LNFGPRWNIDNHQAVRRVPGSEGPGNKLALEASARHIRALEIWCGTAPLAIEVARPIWDGSDRVEDA